MKNPSLDIEDDQRRPEDIPIPEDEDSIELEMQVEALNMLGEDDILERLTATVKPGSRELNFNKLDKKQKELFTMIGGSTEQ